MKKFVVLFTVMLFVSFFTYGQDVYLGLGHIWTGNGNLVKSVDTASLQYQLGFSYDLSSHFYLDTSIHRDTVRVEKWLFEHNFVDSVSNNYEYTILDVGGGYIVNPEDKVNLKLGLFLSGYFSPNDNIDTKLGYGAEVKTEYNFYKGWYAYFGIKYRHTSDFIVKEVNVLETSYGIGYRF